MAFMGDKEMRELKVREVAKRKEAFSEQMGRKMTTRRRERMPPHENMKAQAL